MLSLLITLIIVNFQMGDYSVSLKAPGRNKHFRVHVEGALYCIGQRKFHTLDQLVDHYQRAPIYTNKQGEKLYLVRPLPKGNASSNGCQMNSCHEEGDSPCAFRCIAKIRDACLVISISHISYVYTITINIIGLHVYQCFSIVFTIYTVRYNLLL